MHLHDKPPRRNKRYKTRYIIRFILKLPWRSLALTASAHARNIMDRVQKNSNFLPGIKSWVLIL